MAVSSELFTLNQTVAPVSLPMATSKCLQCGALTDTLALSGLCTVCVSNTTQPTRPAESEAVTRTRTRTRDPLATATHDAPDGWAGVLPAGGYRYEEEVGQGGMGVVWRAVRISTGETVAIKKLRPENVTPAHLRRFVAEARALPRVRHENVVLQHDFVPDPADPYLVLEFVPGESLAAHIKSVGPLHPGRAARMIAEAAAGVQAAHAVGIIHRDLKPGNLLLTERGSVKVADFGLGKVLAEAELPTLVGATTSGDGNTPPASGTLTAPGRLAGGTPGFMAPEQVSDRYGEVGVRADVFGLGACLYACLTAQAPFPVGRGNAERVLTDELVPPRVINPNVPADLSAIAEKCLRKNQSERYESAAAVAADLNRYLAGDETTARRHPWVRRQWRKVRKTPAWVFATAVVVLAVVVVVALALVPKPTTPPRMLTPPPTEPVDVKARQQERFLAGEEVVLVPEKGLPEWSEWVIGKADISESPARDGSAYLNTFTLGAVKLFDVPDVSYRISLDVRHLNAKDVLDETSTAVGFFLCHQRTERADGPWADSFVTVTFRDWDIGPWKKRPPADQPLNAHLRHKFTTGPGGLSETSRQSVVDRPFRFATGIGPPGPWRRLVAEVTPARVRLYWCADATDPTSPLLLAADLSAADLNGEYARYLQSEEARVTRPLPPGIQRSATTDTRLLPRAWNPQGGFGLWVVESEVAFRNVSARRLPPTPE